MSWLDAASWYAQRGWAVLPIHRPTPDGCSCGRPDCGSVGKHPWTRHGALDASHDPEVIRRWAELPGANLGLAMGDPSKVFALDVDPRNGGDATLADLQRSNGPLPTTPTQRTGGGGWHYLFLQPAGVRLRGTIGVGIDIKSTGGFIVAAPSVHENGSLYSWEVDPRTPIANAPEWLIALVLAAPAKAVAEGVCSAAESFIGRCFYAMGWLGRTSTKGIAYARCPWVDQHSADQRGRRTGDGTDSSSVILPPTREHGLGYFQCSHAHCARRTMLDVLRTIPAEALWVIGSQMPAQAQLAMHLLRRAAA